VTHFCADLRLPLRTLRSAGTQRSCRSRKPSGRCTIHRNLRIPSLGLELSSASRSCSVFWKTKLLSSRSGGICPERDVVSLDFCGDESIGAIGSRCDSRRNESPRSRDVHTATDDYGRSRNRSPQLNNDSTVSAASIEPSRN